jgi:hypothetical protein
MIPWFLDSWSAFLYSSHVVIWFFSYHNDWAPVFLLLISLSYFFLMMPILLQWFNSSLNDLTLSFTAWCIAWWSVWLNSCTIHLVCILKLESWLICIIIRLVCMTELLYNDSSCLHDWTRASCMINLVCTIEHLYNDSSCLMIEILWNDSYCLHDRTLTSWLIFLYLWFHSLSTTLFLSPAFLSCPPVLSWYRWFCM